MKADFLDVQREYICRVQDTIQHNQNANDVSMCAVIYNLQRGI